MQATPKQQPTPSRPARLSAWLACSASLLLLSACASQPSAEPPVIARKPKPTAMPQSVKRIDAQPSKQVLQKGCEWSQNTAALLNSETPKSDFCAGSSTPTGG